MLAFTKPEVQFPKFPLIFMYIEHAYQRVETYPEFVDFIHGCLSEAENTKNKIKQEAYQNIAFALYGAENNVSYENKSLELLIKNI